MNPQVRRLALDLGPLLIFFAAFRYLGIFGATACFMVAIAVALGLGYFLERRLSPMPLFTAILVMVFGGLTLYRAGARLPRNSRNPASISARGRLPSSSSGSGRPRSRS